MRSLSAEQKQTILFQLDAGHSVHSIASSTGVSIAAVSRLRSAEHSALQKSVGSCSSKLSSANIRHAVHLISTHKAENAVQVTKELSNIINQPLHPNTIRNHLKKTGLKAVVTIFLRRRRYTRLFPLDLTPLPRRTEHQPYLPTLVTCLVIVLLWTPLRPCFSYPSLPD